MGNNDPFYPVFSFLMTSGLMVMPANIEQLKIEQL